MMSTKKYRIRLTTDEQQELNALVSRGRAAAYKQTHARILLMSDESRSDGGMKDADITSALGVGQSTVERIRKRCVEEGVESALNRKKQLRRRQKRLDGEGEARLIAMACGEPPEGRAQPGNGALGVGQVVARDDAGQYPQALDALPLLSRAGTWTA